MILDVAGLIGMAHAGSAQRKSSAKESAPVTKHFEMRGPSPEASQGIRG